MLRLWEGAVFMNENVCRKEESIHDRRSIRKSLSSVLKGFQLCLSSDNMILTYCHQLMGTIKHSSVSLQEEHDCTFIRCDVVVMPRPVFLHPDEIIWHSVGI